MQIDVLPSLAKDSRTNLRVFCHQKRKAKSDPSRYEWRTFPPRAAEMSESARRGRAGSERVSWYRGKWSRQSKVISPLADTVGSYTRAVHEQKPAEVDEDNELRADGSFGCQRRLDRVREWPSAFGNLDICFRGDERVSMSLRYMI